jgi:hypothetical protein
MPLYGASVEAFVFNLPERSWPALKVGLVEDNTLRTAVTLARAAERC